MIKAKKPGISREFLILLLFMPYFKTSFYENLGVLNQLFNIFLISEFVIFGVLLILNKKCSKFTIGMIIFSIWNYLVAPFLSKSERPDFYYLILSLGFLFLSEFLIRKSVKVYFSSLSSIFNFMIILNFITLFINPYDGVYLFGLRTGIPLYTIPAIGINIINDIINDRHTYSKKTYLCVLVGIAGIAKEWVATGIGEVIIIIFVLTLLKSKIKIKLNKTFILIILLNISIVVFNIQDKFQFIITAILKREVSFTGRVDIWNATIKSILESPLFGHGGISSVIVNDTVKSFHNHWLDIIHQSGLIGFSIILIIIYNLFKGSNRYFSAAYKIYYSITVAMLIATLTEIQSYTPFFYGFLLIGAYINKINISKIELPRLNRYKFINGGR